MEKGVLPARLPWFTLKKYLLFGTINPSHGNVLQDNDNCERHRCRVIIKHSDKVVAGALHKDQPDEESKDATANCKEQVITISTERIAGLLKRSTALFQQK